jgi:hypothetical protein
MEQGTTLLKSGKKNKMKEEEYEKTFYKNYEN